MKSFTVIIIFIVSFCIPLSGQVSDSVKFRLLSSGDFQQTYLNEKKALLVDVREFSDFRKSRIKDAVNIPSSGNLEISADTIDKQSILFIYCTAGFRSKRVAEFFSSKGFDKLYSLKGGIMAWKKDGLPVEKKRLRAPDARLNEPNIVHP